MKNPNHITKGKPPRGRLPGKKQRGFALIVTLSLMILLTVIAVGLLTLSSISLRATTQENAMAVARANARMSLMLALGELQKNAGPDQRITARADVIDEKIANPRLTGVWKSWDIKVDAPPSPQDYEKTERDKKFLGWLTSSTDVIASRKVEFAGKTTVAPVTLWGKGSLGDTAPASDVVTAAKVAMPSSHGAFAWAVMDEGVKVRINTPYVEKASSQGMQTAQLGSGARPNTASVTGLSKLQRPFFESKSPGFATIAKGITKLNFGLATETIATGTKDLLKPLGHDVTSSSVGLFTDTAIGGLREDFSILTNTTSLPSPYAGKGVYATRLGTTGVSDPRWESLQQFARIYQDKTRLSNVGGVPVIKAQGPANWKASAGSDPASGVPGIAQRNPPPGVVLMPDIAKVQVVFSLLTRDIYNYPKVSDTTPKIPGAKADEIKAELHGPWGTNFAGSSYDYLLHLLYTPVVTVHNPYNVALEFTELKIVFGNVPFGLQVIRNGQPQTKGFAPLDTMYYQQSETGTLSKRFGMTLKTNGGTPTSPAVGLTTFRLLPGEVMLFSPYIPATRTWKDEYSGRVFSDWDTGSGVTRTLTIDGLPGWRGDGIGFDLDWFGPSYNGLNAAVDEVENGVAMSRKGCIGAKSTDEFSVKFAPLSVDTLSKNKFTVEMFAKLTTASSFVSSGIIEMDYEYPKGLQDALLGKDGSITYPNPDNPVKTVNTMAMHSHSLTPIKDIATVKPFAVVSAQAKATMGGMNPDGEDGKLATKPWCFAHATVGVSSGKLISEHSANLSHEFAIQRLDNGTNNLLQYDPKTGRGNFITGQTGNTGLKFGAQYDIPLAPVQSLVSLNSANPGGSSGYLPRFAQPIGNSWAHPLLDPSKIITSGGSYPYLDHSFLLNLALYDHFYFSGLADQTGPFIPTGSIKKSADLATDLAAGTPLEDPRITLYNPPGKAPATLATDLAATGAYSRIAARLLMNGAFNINSTSVAAWKAMLGSIHDSQALINKINKTSKSSALATISTTDFSKNEARISRFRLPASESQKDASVDPKEAYWLGAREYSDVDLQLLAEKIVEQVRLRGPFLSMSEFVNRRLGTGETAQRGALQQAIDNANLNKSLAATSSAGFEIPASTVSGYNYRNSAAGTGSSFQGAPGYLSQADLLGVLGNAATARSDTFTIRGYGEARDASGNATAIATCEAVVQRVPEYVDGADNPEISIVSLTSNANKTFGRRFLITSFRWLSATEI
ncbi:MAG: hypothetical protein ABIS50_09685 [Luteolibacter sp.]|uniref:hypothetical protein n=1 Tax=Luteolibacter sp. TaxID=1962973 RepID=UPI003266847E